MIVYIPTFVFAAVQWVRLFRRNVMVEVVMPVDMSKTPVQKYIW